MHAAVTVTPAQLPELLLHIAVLRPVFIWGQPGIGKSSLVEEFAARVGLECCTLLGTQLAAEDLIGVPRIIGEGDQARSRFCPPEAIARDEPYVLFLDELNGSSHEVQKAFYSLILDRRLGNYTLHPESVVNGAGNRSQDSAIVRPVSSALINRMMHVHLVSSPRDWLAWARRSGIHPWVTDYIGQRPDHLTTAPPRHEEPFSTPRAWHILSDLLHSYGAGSADGPDMPDELLRILALGAACVTVNRFLAHLKIGRPPAGLGGPTDHDHLAGAADGEGPFAERLRSLGNPPYLGYAGTGGLGGDLRWAGVPSPNSWRGRANWPDRLATGLASAVGAAVDVAGGVTDQLTGEGGRKTPWRQALNWFISSYPLLGALAAAFKLVEDAEVCRLHGIAVAAISPAAAELYVNPLCGFDDGERRFVVAHELLHAGLRHDTRGGGRDPWLWNVACDYVINGWLAEMEVGDRPDSALYDPSLRGKSAEEVYDEIAAGRRRTWKLATLRGPGACDILPRRLDEADDAARGVDLDEFYRRCLTDGIDYHCGQGRGLIPAGLVEEIRALTEPPVPWDVELARWFDDHFAPLERRRSYARSSRRQSATPDIPRPGWHVPEELMHSRIFGVVLDTSGSMDRRLLGKALGAIASYAVTRDVPAVRVVFCDAEAHDNGFMHPLDIAGRVRVRGRGGTLLQPGIDLLQDAPDFPKHGPILVITDAVIDRVRIKREHAYLIPAGAVLPFPARGPVFRFS